MGKRAANMAVVYEKVELITLYVYVTSLNKTSVEYQLNFNGREWWSAFGVYLRSQKNSINEKTVQASDNPRFLFRAIEKKNFICWS